MPIFHKKKYIFCFLVLSILVPGQGLFPHDERVRNYDDTIRAAKIIAIAEVVKVTITENQCDKNFKYKLKIVSVVKGTISPGTVVDFAYSVYYWKKARWFWQNDCPSVSYMGPSRAKNMNKGSKVILTIEYFETHKKDIATSTANIEKLAYVKNLLGKK
ncbi:MAG: hypothetical protein GY754_40100 [bacterium]|nr:hypothetical protein [bacterium]